MTKKATKPSLKTNQSLEFLAAQVVAAEKDAELAHIQLRHAKAKFKEARRHYKATKARAKEIRQQAKAVARNLKQPLKTAVAAFVASKSKSKAKSLSSSKENA
jgi:hypothetical protein